MEDSKSKENTMMARAHKKTEKILKEYEVEPLPEDVKKRIEEIIEESKKLVR
jgi:trimethylamine:corrinoid methyltransferase-like protein